MDKPARREWLGRFSRFPLGAVGCLIAIVGVERFVLRHADEVEPAHLAIARRVARSTQTEAAKSEILCVGDSMMKFGAIPQVFEKKLGRTAYNVSMTGGQPPGTYYLFRRALRSGAHPAAVVVDFKASLICQSPRLNTREWAEILTLAECLDLATTERDASFFGILALSKLVPSFRVRPEIRSMVCMALAGQPNITISQTTPYLRNTNVNKGAVVMSDALRAPDVPQESINLYFFPDQWTIHPTNVHYMREFVKLAAAHRIPVFWVLPPIKERLQSGRDQGGHDDRYLRAVSWLFVRSPNVFLVDARHSGYPDRAFWDPAHLGRAGALALSAGVATVVGTVLDGKKPSSSRIFQIQQFQDFQFDPMPEDLDTSKVVLHLAPGVMRK